MKSRDFYKSTAWRWFSRYVLLKHAKESNGVYYVTCATSGRQMIVNDKKCHLGHYIKVFGASGHTNFATAFDERNVMPQSHRENVYQGGNQVEMGRAIDRLYGEGVTDEIYRRSKDFCKLDKATMKDISDEYRQKFKELVKVKGNPWR